MDKMADLFPEVRALKRDLPEGMVAIESKTGAKLKHNNQKIKYDGFVFDSLKEAKRWQELQTLAKSGEIISLTRQNRIPCVINGHKVFTYVADFHYKCLIQNKWIIEDSKGWKTPIYKLKMKVLKACYPDFEVLET